MSNLPTPHDHKYERNPVTKIVIVIPYSHSDPTFKNSRIQTDVLKFLTENHFDFIKIWKLHFTHDFNSVWGKIIMNNKKNLTIKGKIIIGNCIKQKSSCTKRMYHESNY